MILVSTVGALVFVIELYLIDRFRQGRMTAYSGRNSKDQFRQSNAIEFVPVRWWQVTKLIRTNFEMLRGHDPWADRLLSKPWALASILEYAYMLMNYRISDAHFVVVSDERVGLTWVMKGKDISFILVVGLLPAFRQRETGLQIARVIMKGSNFIESRAKGRSCGALIGSIAASNDLIYRLMKKLNYNILGLKTTDLVLLNEGKEMLSLCANHHTDAEIKVKAIGRSSAIKAWRRWQIHEVEQRAGDNGVRIAKDLIKEFHWYMDTLPRGEYFSLYQGDQDIGFAFVQQRTDGAMLGLFPSSAFWTEAQTKALVNTMTRHIQTPAQFLRIAITHADALEMSALGFERRVDQERYYVFKLL